MKSKQSDLRGLGWMSAASVVLMVAVISTAMWRSRRVEERVPLPQPRPPIADALGETEMLAPSPAESEEFCRAAWACRVQLELAERARVAVDANGNPYGGRP